MAKPKRTWVVTLTDGRRLPVQATNEDDARRIVKKYLTELDSRGVRRPATIAKVR